MRGLVIALVVFASGCVGPEEPAADPGTAASIDNEVSQAAEPDSGESGPAPYIETFNRSGVVRAAILGLNANSGDGPGMAIKVPVNVSFMVVEGRWTGDVAEVDLRVSTPAFCVGAAPIPLTGWDSMICHTRATIDPEMPGIFIASRPVGSFGSGALRLVLDDTIMDEDWCRDVTCPWTVQLYGRVAAETSFELAATVFAGTEPPEGFSVFSG